MFCAGDLETVILPFSTKCNDVIHTLSLVTPYCDPLGCETFSGVIVINNLDTKGGRFFPFSVFLLCYSEKS